MEEIWAKVTSTRCPLPCHWNWMAFKVPSNLSPLHDSVFFGFGQPVKRRMAMGASMWGWMTRFAWCTVQELGLIVKLWMWTEAGEPCLSSIRIAHFTYSHSLNSIWNEAQWRKPELSMQIPKEFCSRQVTFYALEKKISQRANLRSPIEPTLWAP